MSDLDPAEWIGLVPAAGRGLRLGLPYPKELYPIIAGDRYKPVAQHVIENLVAAGVEHTVLVINETKHQLIGYFGDGSRFGCRFSYVVQEPGSAGSTPSGGLAEALDAAWHLTRGRTVVFGMADTIVQPVEAFRGLTGERHRSADLVLGLFETDEPHKFGMVELDAQQRVQRIVDKPRETELRLMWGCMLWRPAFTEYLHELLALGRSLDFAGILNAAIAEGMHLAGVRIEGGTYIDVGTYEEIARLEQRYRR